MPPPCRTPPGQKPGYPPGPAPTAPLMAMVSMPLWTDDTSTAVRGYSSSWSPPDTSRAPFSTSLTTTVFSQRSMWWFEASARPATPKGQTFISYRTPIPESPTYLHPDPHSSFVAHYRWPLYNGVAVTPRILPGHPHSPT